MHAHIHTHTYAYIRIHTHTYAYIRIHTHTHTHTHKQTNRQTHTHTHAHTHTHTQIERKLEVGMIISYYWPPLCISKENMVEEVTVTRIDVEEETVSTTGFMHILSVDNDDCIWFGDLSGGSHRLSDLHLVAGELNIRDASDVLRDRYNETLCHMHDQAKGPGLNLDYTETLLPRPSLPERRTVGRIIGEETESSSESDGGGGRG
jgi:hypothetical protein